MNQACTSNVTEAVERAIAALDLDRLERDYWDQNEFLYIPEFLPREFVNVGKRCRITLNSCICYYFSYSVIFVCVLTILCRCG